jgi:hypothetical protein
MHSDFISLVSQSRFTAAYQPMICSRLLVATCALMAEVLAWQRTLPASPLRDQAADGIKSPSPKRPAKGKKKA